MTTKDEALRLALEWIEAQPEPRMIGAAKVVQSLRAALAQKANKHGWIRHRGGKMPVDGEVLVTIRQRNSALRQQAAEDCQWKHVGGSYDVMAYAVVKEQRNEEPAKFDPVALRDRYMAVDQQIADKLQEVAVLKDERVSILDALNAEGFALVGV